MMVCDDVIKHPVLKLVITDMKGRSRARFQISTAFPLTIQIFWDVTLCRWEFPDVSKLHSAFFKD